VAEWLRSGLQNRLHEFDSRRRLKEMIAITGSGEFLPTIKYVDNVLLSYINNPYVLTFSTAAGKESEEKQEYWENLANTHFKSLNVRHKHIKARNKEEIINNDVLYEISKSNFVYFSGGNPQHLFNSINNNKFINELLRIKKEGILAGCSAGSMIMGERMIKGKGLNFIKNSIIIPHYGESYYSWITNTIKILNKGKYKLICLEKDTYFVMNESEIKIIGKNNIHIIYKKDHQTFSDGDTLDLSILEL
tara:strand:- start:933 stop:1676 length:744 start_codon:yes stop_codon:yes gene_type:complete